MKQIGIYKIISPTGKIYVGQSIDLKKRKIKYRSLDCKSQIRLYNSLKKYGWENHKFEIIEQCKVDDLNCKERYWQDYYNVLSNKGLNCKLTITNDKSGKLSELTKNKISRSNKGKNLGKKHSKKTKEIISSKNKGKKRNKKFCKNLSKIHLGKKMSKSSRQKMSDNNHMSKTVICLITGKKWKSAKACSEETGINYKYLLNVMNGAIKVNKTSYRYA